MYVLAAALLAASIDTLPAEMTLADAYRRAREAAGAIRAGEARVDEARGRLIAARALRDNPSLDAALGRRRPSGGTLDQPSRTDVELGIEQTFELGGKRAGRVRVATAAVEREVASSGDVTRRLLRDVGAQFYEAARTQERTRLAATSEGAAEELVRVARVRLAQGDVAALDVNLAETLLARARASRLSFGADRVTAIALLKGLLRLPPDAEIALDATVNLESLAPELPPPTWNDVLAGRPDLRALEAEVREAQAEIETARALRWPDATPAVRYSREEGTPIAWAGLTITLPVSNRGAGERLAAEARLRRVRTELEATKASVEADLRAAYSSYGARRAAAQSLAAIIGTLDESLELARRSYESGQIGLGDLLVVRRETLEARAEAIDHIFGAAAARVQLEAAMGVLR